MEPASDTFLDLSHATIERLSLRIAEAVSPPPAITVPIIQTGAGPLIVYPGACILYGWIAGSSAGGTLIFRDGDSVNGIILGVPVLTAGAFQTAILPAVGVTVQSRLMVQVATDVNGAAFIRPLPIR